MLQVAVAGLLAHRFRLILTAATIALGVALVAGTFILTDSVAGALGSSAGPAQVVVLRPGPAGGKGPAAPASLPASLVRRVRAVRGVARAEGLVTADKVVLTGPRGRPVLHRRAVNELLSCTDHGRW